MLHAIDVFRYPEQRLKITQAALGFLDVRFHDIPQALFAMTCGTFLELCFNEAAAGTGEQFGFESLIQILRQTEVAGDKTMLEQRGLYGEIFAPQLNTVTNGAGRVPHLQLKVPQNIEY